MQNHIGNRKLFHARRNEGLRLSGRVKVKPQDNPEYSNFTQRLRERNEWEEFPVKRHPKQLEAETWNFTKDMRARPAFQPVIQEPRKSPIYFVNTRSNFEEMFQHLKSQNLLALDLENNIECGYWTSYACVLQISTLTKDFIVCPFILHREITRLREITENPKILKLTFSSFNDLKTFQTQWNLFFVGMIDVQKVFMEFNAEECDGNLPSFTKVVTHYFPYVKINKSAQLCDWRVRPLNAGMMKYARDDTHLLIRTWLQLKFIHMKPEFEINWTRIVSQCNIMVQIMVFIQPYPTAQRTLEKSKFNLSLKQQRLFTELYEWRQEVAKREDEKPAKIMSDKDVYNCCILLPAEVYTDDSDETPKIGLDKTIRLNQFILKEAYNILTIIQKYVDSRNKRESKSEIQSKPSTSKRLKSIVVVINNPNNTECRDQESDNSSVDLESGIQESVFPSTENECGVQDSEIPSFQKDSHQPSHSIESIREMLDVLGSKYDNQELFALPQPDIEVTVENDNIPETQGQVDSQLEPISDCEMEDGIDTSTNLMCYRCYEVGHTKPKCKYNDPELRRDPQVREFLLKNKTAFYADRPLIKAKRNRNRHVKYRENRALRRLEDSSISQELDLLLDPA